ncbi:hypothetical protein GHT07_06090 [Caenimonas koreensis DSM 17982]|uniref:Dolichyl-phosphate-mannose-protein mannosyltransferase n=1 Tax=Caenimonas koreensis DSM 17982 TaxID=1121255 RepID=A0A844B5R1_9BURK|nr:hypothetical protein [Caenimonas koreensis]MRD46837.1 hypothetical protein [Caenimonas koreensis DSM 17982]
MLKQLADRLSHPGQGHPRGLRIGAIILVMLCAIGGGTLSLAPLVWTDSTTFVSSALATLNTGSLQLHAGRGAGYVALLAGLFAAGGTMTAAVLAQQVAWCASMGLMAFVVVRMLPLGYALFVMALAFYPGLQLFNNLILAESLYASTLVAALCLIVLATTSKRPRMACLLLAVAITLTAMAALLKAQGIPVFAAVGAISLWIAWRQRSSITAAVVVMSLAAASVVLAASLGTK